MESLSYVLERLPVQSAICGVEQWFQQAAPWTCVAVVAGAFLGSGYVVLRVAMARKSTRK